MSKLKQDRSPLWSRFVGAIQPFVCNPQLTRKKGSRLKPNNCYLNEMLKKTAIKEFVFKHKPQPELFSISLKYSDTKSMITVFVVTQVKICLFCTSDFYFSSQSLNILFLHLI